VRKSLELTVTGRNSTGCLDQLRKGDVVTVWKLDRLARSTRNLLEIVETISNAGARFQSISETWADTTTHAGKMIMTISRG
jgi:DNA invertase Pin-like site-specific DNA recombinase